MTINEIDPFLKAKQRIARSGTQVIDGSNVSRLAPNSPFIEAIQQGEAAITMGRGVPHVIYRENYRRS